MWVRGLIVPSLPRLHSNAAQTIVYTPTQGRAADHSLSSGDAVLRSARMVHEPAAAAAAAALHRGHSFVAPAA